MYNRIYFQHQIIWDFYCFRISNIFFYSNSFYNFKCIHNIYKLTPIRSANLKETISRQYNLNIVESGLKYHNPSPNLMLKVYTIIHFIDGKEMKNKWSFGFEHAATEWSPTSDRNIFVRYNYFILNVFKLFIYLFI
jgi:hypothetical protein